MSVNGDVTTTDGEIINLDRWTDYTNCAGLSPAAFFPGLTADPETARPICLRCVVRTQCVAYAAQANAEHPVGIDA